MAHQKTDEMSFCKYNFIIFLMAGRYRNHNVRYLFKPHNSRDAWGGPYICGQIDTPIIVRSPYRNNEIIFATRKAVYSPPGLGFNITYHTYECGGILSGPIDMIQTNNYPQTYPASTECVWLLEYPEGDQIVV